MVGLEGRRLPGVRVAIMTVLIRRGRLWCCVLAFVSCFVMSAKVNTATAHDVPKVYPSRFAGTSEGFYWDPSITNSTSPQAATLKDAIGDARTRWNELALLQGRPTWRRGVGHA